MAVFTRVKPHINVTTVTIEGDSMDYLNGPKKHSDKNSAGVTLKKIAPPEKNS
jgi:hypothetical protein